MLNQVTIILKETQTSEQIAADNQIKERLSEKYFQKGNIKHLRKILFTTPQGNKCECYINKNPNSLLGSMVITKVNGIDTEQFVHGMPKLHYYNNYLETLEQLVETEKRWLFDLIEIVEKYDGTNICLYKLHDPETGQVIEIVPKTRNMPILSVEFQELYNTVRNVNIENYLQLHPEIHTLLFELWGDNNPHQISYPKSPKLNLTLLCEYTKDYKLTHNYKGLYATGIRTPHVLGYIHNTKYYSESKDLDWNANIFPNETANTKKYYPTNGNYNPEHQTLQGLLETIEQHYEKINQDHLEQNGNYAIEGVILRTTINNKNILMKLKPTSIKEQHTLSNGIPNQIIQKEVIKFYDEYGKQEAKNLISNNIEQAINYIQDNLLEEYKHTYVTSPKTVKKIKKQLTKHTQKVAIKKELQNIAEELIKNNTEKNISDLMRIFSQEYSEYKHQSQEMYNAIKEKNN